MNNKKTNYVIATIDCIAIISFYILYFTQNYLVNSMMTGPDGSRNVYGNFVIDCLLLNIKTVMIVFTLGIAIPNIISAIQNIKDKRLSFWQFVFGIIEIVSAIELLIPSNITIIEEWINRIMFVVIPIVLMIRNIILLKKNKPTRMSLISYILVIIIAIIEIFGLFGAGTCWLIMSIIMQFIYIHNQEKCIVESNKRKIFNAILYYIIQTLVAGIFLFMIIYSLMVVKINEIRLEKQISKLYNDITTLKEITNKEDYIPVENNKKYGFINQEGKEVISCDYDRVTYFNEIEINNNTCYIALAKKDNQFYILSKGNDKIGINGVLRKQLQAMDKYWNDGIIEMQNKYGNYRNGYLTSFESFLRFLFEQKEVVVKEQTLEVINTNNEIYLEEDSSKYYYDNDNYTMQIEPVSNDTEDSEKYNVTIIKSDGEKVSSIVYLPEFNEEDATIATFSNGYIEFESEDHTKIGWYDDDGNKTTISSNYLIVDIKDDKIILQVLDDEDEKSDANRKSELYFVVIDTSGKTLLQTTALDIYDNMYLVKNKDKKMVLVDEDFKRISNEYDRIITNKQADMLPEYSFYY